MYIFNYRYIYTGVLELTTNNVREVTFAADYFLLNPCLRICEPFLRNMMNNSSCIGLWALSRQHCLLMLLTDAECYFTNNFKLMLQESNTLAELDVEQMNKAVRFDMLAADDETQVAQFVIDWCLFDRPNRQQYLYDLLCHVYLLDVCPKLLQSFLQMPLVIDDAYARSLIERVLRKMSLAEDDVHLTDLCSTLCRPYFQREIPMWLYA